MSRLAIHRGGSAITVKLHNVVDHRVFEGIVIWPHEESGIYLLSNESSLNGCLPISSDWKKHGHAYSYLLGNGNTDLGMYTLDLIPALPHNIAFVGFGGVVDPSRIGEAALKMDLNSLRKGEGLACEITSSDNKLLIGRLFRSKAGNIYMLHQNASAMGSAPSDENWRHKSGYQYSWQLLENDLSNDCKPETYRRTGPAVKICDYDVEINHRERVKKDISSALAILRPDVGARVQLRTDTGKLLTGILIKHDKSYYILHDNADARGDSPSLTYKSRDGLILPYSWWLDRDLYTSSNMELDSFLLMTHIPMHLDVYDPRAPKAGGVGVGYDPVTFEKKESKEETWHPLTDATVAIKNEEPELIMFKKPTAKVTRCDVQPMQSPQIITKNKK